MTAPWEPYIDRDRDGDYADYCGWQDWMTAQLTWAPSEEMEWWKNADIYEAIDLYAVHCDELDRLEAR